MMTHFLAVVLATGLSGSTGAISPGESVEEAARAYRIQVYQTFRLDREEFDRRRAEWRRLEEAWYAAGKPDSDAALLVDWLEEATEQSTADSQGPLPELPKLTAATRPDRATTAKRGESQESTDALTPAGVPERESTKTSPVSSHRKLDDASIDEKTPNETAPVASPVDSPSNPAVSTSARANAPAAVWYHRFERWLGEEIDAIAPPASQESN